MVTNDRTWCSKNRKWKTILFQRFVCLRWFNKSSGKYDAGCRCYANFHNVLFIYIFLPSDTKLFVKLFTGVTLTAGTSVQSLRNCLCAMCPNFRPVAVFRNFLYLRVIPLLFVNVYITVHVTWKHEGKCVISLLTLPWDELIFTMLSEITGLRNLGQHSQVDDILRM